MVKGYKDWVRIEEFEYPEDVIREAIVNALVHKDYLGSHIQMKIFEDKITLWNSGTLLKGITVDELKKPHGSVHRNELISNTFYKAELIEAWGRGTTFMVDECLKAELPEPEYREYFGGFELTLHKDKLTEKYLRGLELNDRQIEIVFLAKKNSRINNKLIVEKLNVSRQTVTNDLSLLVDKGIFERKGSGAGSEYIVKLTKSTNA
ncbi:MAG: ATP-binding protein [Bacteroidota bacterium]|nr:ATP-binding protein [Bacteroidota bacterium]